MTLSAGANFAGYTIVRLLGAGGMGEVYLAKHPRLNRHDALKILPAAYANDAEYRRRFGREADLAASLWHPNIVGVHDRGEVDGQLWISMDYVDGTDAATLRRQYHRSGMPRHDVIEVTKAVGAALDFAHSRNLLHRDVKPANILLTDPADGPQRILLADFGIARNLGDATRLTATNMTVGTISYAAPEQLAGEQVSGSADEYALAATAYHLLTGKPPFDDPSPAVVIARHLSAPVPPISALRPDLADLDAVFAKALAKDPDRRYASCGDFAAALGADAAVPTQAAGTASPATPAGIFTPPPPVASARSTPSSRPTVPVPAAVLTAVGVLLVAALTWVGFLLSRPGRRDGAPVAPVASATPTTARIAAASPAPRTVWSTVTAVSPPPPPTASRMLLPDADAQGFFAGGARCDGTDRAALIVRTQVSTAVVCATPAGQYYYRGVRASDGAGIDLSNVERTATGFTAVNDRDPTYYKLSRGGLQIIQNGQVISNEPAVESAG